MAEAVRRALDVTAVVRGENRSQAPHVITKSIEELSRADQAPFDVVDEIEAGKHQNEHVTVNSK